MTLALPGLLTGVQGGVVLGSQQPVKVLVVVRGAQGQDLLGEGPAGECRAPRVGPVPRAEAFPVPGGRG